MNLINDWNPGEIEKKLGHTFQNPSLLQEAFTHKSYYNENKEAFSRFNERLEFLGDAVLELLASDYLFCHFPDEAEGFLTKTRSKIVETQALSSFITELELGSYLLLGKGEALQSGRAKDSLFANLFEAILGAIYLDGGFEAANAFFDNKVEPLLERPLLEGKENWKARFQELIQKEEKVTPTYEVIQEEGPSHEKIFRVAAKLENNIAGEGVGRSKKEAEQNAAKDALEKREKRDG